MKPHSPLDIVLSRRQALSTVAMALLAGCGGGGAPGPSSSSGGGSAADDGTVLRVAQQTEPTKIDPAQVEDGPTIEFLMQVFEGLVQWNKESKVVPCLAEKWDVTDGGKTYTFHLRKGARFHNGREVTAEDFVYSLTRVLDPKTPSTTATTYLGDILGALDFNSGKATSLPGVEAVDPQTLRIRIDAPKAYFLSKLTYPTGYAVCKEAIEGTGGEVTDASMIGTGAFKMAEYRKGDRIILEANKDYWEGVPKLERVERRILLDNNTRHDKFEAGELDITDISMAQHRADVQNAELAKLMHTFPRPSVYYMSLNQQAYPPFKDKRVRQAFAMAVNKAEIVKTVHEGVPPVAHGIVPPGVPGHDKGFQGLPYDPDRARKLLAEAGFPGGQGLPPLTLFFRASVEDIRNTAVAIAGDLEKNLGIKVQLEETDWGVFLEKRNRGELPFSFLRWAADYLDPQNFLSTMLRTGVRENTIGYSSAEFDRLCDSADVMQDPAKRLATYAKAQAIAIDDAPWVPIYYQTDVELWNPRLRGVEDSAMGHLPHKRTHFGDGAAESQTKP